MIGFPRPRCHGPQDAPRAPRPAQQGAPIALRRAARDSCPGRVLLAEGERQERTRDQTIERLSWLCGYRSAPFAAHPRGATAAMADREERDRGLAEGPDLP